MSAVYCAKGHKSLKVGCAACVTSLESRAVSNLHRAEQAEAELAECFEFYWRTRAEQAEAELERLRAGIQQLHGDLNWERDAATVEALEALLEKPL